MALSAIIIVVIAFAGFLFGVILTWMGLCYHPFDRSTQFLCSCSGPIFSRTCWQKRAFYYARLYIWRHEASDRDRENAKNWLLDEIEAIDVEATSEQKASTVLPACYPDELNYEKWEELELIGKKYRERLAAGEDERKACRKAAEDFSKATYWCADIVEGESAQDKV
ncbi:hypothetical protein EYC80_006502 [Monilinia laxa]|uniref:Uncharacterized protein n=1 Tax=Monilinia laxa TaxID=61186 RepID=A0A5N6JUX4_MONLA|nr:hypothetical protein EYC80_006502 [Monilinia laxa]